MHIAYPYSGTGVVYGAASVFEQSLGIGDAATVAAYQAIMAAAQDSGPINIVAFSGGAQAFTSAMWALPMSVSERIQNVTYISPGAGFWPLPSGSGVTNAVVGSSALEIGLRLPYQVPPGTTFMNTDCGHDLDCQIRAARQLLENTKGNSCTGPATFSGHIEPPYGWVPGGIKTFYETYTFTYYTTYYLNWWFTTNSWVEQVSSTITYDTQ
jgi:hypothetical protein